MPIIDRIWLWIPRGLGIYLAYKDGTAGTIEESEIIFYLVLIFGPEAVRRDLAEILAKRDEQQGEQGK